MGLMPTLLAIGIGVFLGLRGGGRIDHLLNWRPPLWKVLVGGVGLMMLLDLVPWSGPFVAFVRIAAIAALTGFAIINVRVGGMVLVVVGLGLNLVVAVLNWGVPVSRSALVSAGIVTQQQLPNLVLTGGRRVADSGTVLGFLGGVIPLPWGHVVSIGDLVTLVGICLVTSSVVRRYEVIGASPFGPLGGGRGPAPREYRDALDALGRGPAPRRGPGLHPSRMATPRGVRRRSSPPMGRSPRLDRPRGQRPPSGNPPR